MIEPESNETKVLLRSTLTPRRPLNDLHELFESLVPEFFDIGDDERLQQIKSAKNRCIVKGEYVRQDGLGRVSEKGILRIVSFIQECWGIEDATCFTYYFSKMDGAEASRLVAQYLVLLEVNKTRQS
jgi:hypothetical protein